MYIELAILALFIFPYSMVAGRIERSVVSGSMVFVVVGFLLLTGGGYFSQVLMVCEIC